ncbi:cysteine--tRNA ligase [Candidatus Gottesmanbacteria bacterium]|nr:cysteine--tRNA ligase [Candidatus Gottesmanbacteria bacterium]
MLRIYNTLTRRTEEFHPINDQLVGFYSCGPTVYDYAHIGHARTYVFNDILQRILEFDGYRVKRVMNITDVGHLTSDQDTGEDKMEKGAAREKKSVWEIADFYTRDFFKMLSQLNIRKPDIIIKATDYVPQMIELIKILEKKGFTYTISDGVYFDTEKLPDYGKLTGMNFEELQQSLKAGARVEVVPGKKHPTDFALWKFSPATASGLPKRQMEWDSTWGKGFPGWHIECSVMGMAVLGNHFDVHTGGVDHIQVHHTNEIAQSEAATGEKFVNYWLHGEHLLVDGQKMSKSLGNFYRVEDIVKKGFDPLALRYLFLTASYRMQMNFTWEALQSAQNALKNFKFEILNLKSKNGLERTVLSEDKLKKVDDYRQKFTDAVNDDLNTPKALAVSWEVLKSNIPSPDKYDLIMFFDEVLGLDLKNAKLKMQNAKIPAEVMELVKRREELRKKGKFEEADRVREEIKDKGYEVEDTTTGSLIKKN